MGNVAIMDSTVVKEEDLGGQFFLSEDDVGKRNRAEASVDGLQVFHLQARLITHAALSCLPFPKSLTFFAASGIEPTCHGDGVQRRCGHTG